MTSGDDRLWHAAASGPRRRHPRAPRHVRLAVLFAGDAIWVALASPASLASYDPETLEPGITVELPREPVDLALVDGRLAVAVR